MSNVLTSTKVLDLVGLSSLMELNSGMPEVVVGLFDGPVVMDHPNLSENLREAPGVVGGGCSQASSTACLHGTFVAGILSARRGSQAPSICPGCTLLIHPLFKETSPSSGMMPNVTPEELSEAIIESVNAGAWVLNLSAAFSEPSTRGEHTLEKALNYAARHQVIVVAAAGNQGTLGSSAITRYPWVIPVVGCNLHGSPTNESNLGSSVGKRGLMAPGESITSLRAEGALITLGGTSVAAPFVTGCIALLWSMFPSASATDVKSAVTGGYARRRASIVPPLLDAKVAYEAMVKFGS